MSGAQSISTRRAYGVQRVCRVWHCARSSVYARRQATPSPERFIRTLKENLLWGRSFATIEELRLALLAFKRTYNEQWMLEKRLWLSGFLSH